MPFNKIMNLAQLSLLIFSLISCRVLGETSWEPNQARYNGYDLRRGPVFYEVYYANDNWPSATDRRQAPGVRKPERQYANDGRILEKTYQAASDPFYNAAREANFEPEEKIIVDRRYAQPKQPINIFPYRRDMLPNPREYTGGENNENYQTTGQLANFVESNEHNYPPTGLLRDLHSRANFVEPNAGRADDSVSSYTSRKFENDYIRPLLSAIESSAREILEKQIRRETLAQIGNNAKTSRSPRFAESKNPDDQGGLGMRVVLARHAGTPSRSENFDSAISRSESGDWRSTNQRVNDLSMDQSHLQNQYDQRASIPCEPFAPKENIFESRTQASNRVISETLAPTNEQSFFLGEESEGQPQESQPSNLNYQPPRSYSQNLIEEAKKESEETSEKTPIVTSIEVSEVTRHKVRHHHGEKPRHKHRHHHGEAGH